MEHHGLLRVCSIASLLFSSCGGATKATDVSMPSKPAPAFVEPSGEAPKPSSLPENLAVEEEPAERELPTFPIRLERRCSERMKSSLLASRPTDQRILSARTLNERTWIRLTNRSVAEVSLDGGKSWVESLRASPMGPSMLELTDKGELWALNSRTAWRTNDGRNWEEKRLQGVKPGATTYYDALLEWRGESWVFSRDERALLQLSPDQGSAPVVVRLPGAGRLRAVSSVGDRLVAVGSNLGAATVVDISEGRVQRQVTVQGTIADHVTCRGATCVAMLGMDLGSRERPEGEWVAHGNIVELMKWFSDNCDTSRVSSILKTLKRGDTAMEFSIGGVAFEREHVAISMVLPIGKETDHGATLLLGPTGIEVLPIGSSGVWAKSRGEFWVFGPEIYSVNVGSVGREE